MSGLADKHKPGTIGLYLLTFRLLLDFAGTEPNPARDGRVRKPRQVREEANPPSAEQFLAIVEAMGEKWRLHVRDDRAGRPAARRGGRPQVG